VLPPVAITLHAMRFHAIVGILPHERELPQPLEVDLTALVAAERSTPLDYRALYAAAERAVDGAHGYLEELAVALAEDTLTLPGVQHVAVAVRKPHVALPGPLAYAEVRLERGRAH
jgi:7,8-dihydroneopterin aldolase/epimerase/oxygenase